jgi:hypothetical protein
MEVSLAVSSKNLAVKSNQNGSPLNTYVAADQRAFGGKVSVENAKKRGEMA